MLLLVLACHVALSACLSTHSNLSTRLPTRSTGLSTRSTGLSTHSNVSLLIVSFCPLVVLVVPSVGLLMNDSNICE